MALYNYTVIKYRWALLFCFVLETELSTISSADGRGAAPIPFNPNSPFAFEPPDYDSLPKDPPNYIELYGMEQQQQPQSETDPDPPLTASSDPITGWVTMVTPDTDQQPENISHQGVTNSGFQLDLTESPPAYATNGGDWQDATIDEYATIDECATIDEYPPYTTNDGPYTTNDGHVQYATNDGELQHTTNDGPYTTEDRLYTTTVVLRGDGAHTTGDEQCLAISYEAENRNPTSREGEIKMDRSSRHSPTNDDRYNN